MLSATSAGVPRAVSVLDAADFAALNLVVLTP